MEFSLSGGVWSANACYETRHGFITELFLFPYYTCPRTKQRSPCFIFCPPPLVCVSVFNDGRSSFLMLIGGLDWGLCIEMHVLYEAQELGFLVDNGLSKNGPWCGDFKRLEQIWKQVGLFLLSFCKRWWNYEALHISLNWKACSLDCCYFFVTGNVEGVNNAMFWYV